jgi:radical SAM protein with 4Fe4S-binding SPASM domain
MRKEKTMILLYKMDPFDGISVEKYSFLHPLAAILLVMFDGKKTPQRVIKDFSYICDLQEEDGEKLVSELWQQMKKNIGDDLLIESSARESQDGRYDPTQFIILKDEIKLEAFRLGAPLTLSYDVTHKCMRRCIYCYAENEFSPSFNLLPLSRVKEVLTEAKQLGVHSVLFGGGDAFARRDFISILEQAIALKLRYFVSTKAFLSRQTCHRLKAAGLERIQVSIDSADRAMADFLTGSKGYLDQAVRTIQGLQDVGIEVSCKAVVTSFNAEGIPDLCQFLAGLGIKTIRVTGYGRSVYRHSDALFASAEQLRRLQDRLESFKELHPDIRMVVGGFTLEEPSPTPEQRQKRFSKRAACTAGRQSLHILPDGKVTLCEQLPSQEGFVMGDLSRQSLLEIWNSDKVRAWLFPDKELFKGTVCYECPDFIECNTGKGRCYRNAYNLFQSPFAPVPECPYLEQGVRFS